MIAIVKPVGNYCNLRCAYCFYNCKDQGHRVLMTDEMVEKLLTSLREVSEQALIIWHGGEPLLAGMPFYRKVFARERELWELGKIQNLVQTNGTLINQGWARFFKENDFGVGVSLDGCPAQHDTHRVTVHDKGSHALALRGIRVLQQNRVGFGVIQTVTHDTLDYVEESFDFLHETVGTKSFSLNVFQSFDRENEWPRSQNVSDQEWGDYLGRVWQKWLQADDPDLRVREIETAIQGATGKLARACRFNGSCGQYFCLEPNGDIYPCDRFMRPEDLWGNLHHSSLKEILEGEQRKAFIRGNTKSYENCSGCGWLKACHNGCGSQRIGGITGKFCYCDSSKRMFELAQKALEEYSTMEGGGEDARSNGGRSSCRAG